MKREWNGYVKRLEVSMVIQYDPTVTNMHPWQDWETCALCEHEGVCIDIFDDGLWVHGLCMVLYILKNHSMFMPFYVNALKRMEHRYDAG